MSRTLRRLVPPPVAAKVPEITVLFWVVKLLTTAGGEAFSDYFALGNRVLGAGIETGLLVGALVWQARSRRYHAFAYWSLAYAIAIFGTGVADALHLIVGLPYAATTLLWAVVLASVFGTWWRTERTLSIHSITTTRREAFYWSTVFATFALGTSVGDLTAFTLHLGFLTSGVLFGVAFLVPALLWRLGLDPVLAFWASYVLTRPLGASFADYLSKPPALSGYGFGDLPTAGCFFLAVACLVTVLAVTRLDIQPSRRAAHAAGRPAAGLAPAEAAPGT